LHSKEVSQPPTSSYFGHVDYAPPISDVTGVM
jgi:hypothetical protein